MPIIEIKDFKGVFTNADVEDLPVEYMTSVKNMRSYNGRLVKTFGPELKISATVELNNLATYIHKELTSDGLNGKVYIGIRVTGSGGSIVLYGYKDSDSQWYILDLLSYFSLGVAMSFRHKNDRNPIIQVDGIMRFLPGNISDIGGIEAIGVWIGHIKREIWGGIESLENFYIYPVTIEKPELVYPTRLAADNPEALIQKIDGPRVDEIAEGDKYYYKFSYVYDGIQEGLLSEDAVVYDGVTLDDDGAVEEPSWYHILFSIRKLTFNKRITSIKVYRSEVQSGDYAHIHTIDFLRPADKIKKGDRGIRYGNNYCYVPELSSFNFKAGSSYTIELPGELIPPVYELYSVISGGQDVFWLTSELVESDFWDKPFELYEDGGDEPVHSNANGGFYAGEQTIIISPTFLSSEQEFEADKYVEGVLAFGDENDNKKAINIDKYYKKAFHSPMVRDDVEAGDSQFNIAWYLMSVANGLFIAEENGYYVDFWFYDPGLAAGPYHPLAGEVSVKANGDVAQVIGGRLWQGNPILDPGGKNEEHIGRAIYSEIEQYDVNAVGNLLSLPDREGGAITGIAEILGNPVFTKPQAIHTIDIKGVIPPFPIIKSEHNIGNIARRGLVQVGESLFVCYYDGIYRLTPNNLAESDDTPTERLKISDPIGDMYQGMTLERKKAIEAQYDQRKGEIIYKMNDQLWAYNIDTGFWRQHDYDVEFGIMALDETANIIIYDDTDQKVYTLGGDNFAAASIKLKQFRLSEERAEVIRYFTIVYQSITVLTLNLYTEYGDTPVATYTLPKNSKITTLKIGIRRRAEVFTFELIAPRAPFGAGDAQLWDMLGAVDNERIVINPDGLSADTVFDITGSLVHLQDSPVSNHIWTVDGDRVYLNPLVRTVINKIKIEHT